MAPRKGFTLLELLLTLSVIAIAVAIGVPWFGATVEAARVTAAINQLVRAVHLGKIEAAKRFEEVVLCPASGGGSCADATAAWQDGWMLFVNLDRDRPAMRDADEPVLARATHDARLRVAVNRKRFAFHQFARRSTNGTMVICSRSRPGIARAVVISYTGRPRTARLRRDGKPYRCER